MKAFLPNSALLAVLTIFSLLAIPPVSQATGSTDDGIKQIPLPCPSSKTKVEGSPCNGSIARITIATPSELYSNLRDAIVPLRRGKFGFSANIVAAAFGLKPAKRTFSAEPLKFTKFRLATELQTIKNLGSIQSKLPALITVEVVGKRSQVFAAKYVRALFLSQLFPQKIEIAASSSNGPIRTGLFYIILDRNYVDDAKTSLSNLADSETETVRDQAKVVNSARASTLPLRLLRASLATDEPTKGPSGPAKTSSGKIAEWFPRIAIGNLEVRMVVEGNHWKCGLWKDLLSGPLDPLPSRLREVGASAGCVLNLSVDIPKGTDGVYRYFTVIGILDDPFACAPRNFGAMPEEGVTSPRCDTGLLRWGIEKSRIANANEPPSFQVAVPSFDFKTLPKLTLGIAGEENVNFVSPRDKSCWCSPKECPEVERVRCEKELDR